MSKPWVPRPYQPIMSTFVLENERCNLFVSMGMGKSSTMLFAVDCLLVSGHINKALVLAPLRVARGTWPDEAGKWCEFQHLKVVFVGDEWTPAEREFLRAWRTLGNDPPAQKKQAVAALRPAAVRSFLGRTRQADIVTINYDRIRELVAILGDQWPFDMVIADEVSRVKSFRLQQGGKRAQALGKVAHTHVKRWVGLTGTPAANGLQDLWALIWFLDRGHRLGNTYTAFMDRWFGFRRKKDAVNPDGGYVERIVFPHSQVEIQGLLKDICLTLDPKDWFDLDEPLVNTLYVDLPPRARKHYREMEREFFTSIEGHDIEAFGAAAKALKALQLAAGAAYVEGSNTKWEEVHDEKLQALESIVEEAAGAPVLVAYHFKSDLARLKARFPHGIDVATAAGLKRAQAGEGTVWFGHPASMGHGVDGLQYHCNTAVFFSAWFALEEHLQFIERIGPVRQKQAGKERPVHLHYIVARDTVDEQVLERLTTKRETQDILLDALNRYKERNK